MMLEISTTIELQTYGLNKEILVRFELYNAELLRQNVKMGEDYANASIVRSMIISYNHYLKDCPFYKCPFKMHDRSIISITHLTAKKLPLFNLIILIRL